MTNKQIVRNFLHGIPAKGDNIRSEVIDGGEMLVLFSYQEPIAAMYATSSKIVVASARSLERSSRTTSSHIGMVLRMAGCGVERCDDLRAVMKRAEAGAGRRFLTAK